MPELPEGAAERGDDGPTTATEESVKRLSALQRRNKDRIAKFMATYGQAPNFTMILLNEIISAMFEKNSQEHIDFMLRVEQQIENGMKVAESEMNSQRLVVPGPGKVPQGLFQSPAARG